MVTNQPESTIVLRTSEGPTPIAYAAAAYAAAKAYNGVLPMIAEVESYVSDAVTSDSHTEDLEDHVADLLASLRHLCDLKGYDFAELDQRAYGNYSGERHDFAEWQRENLDAQPSQDDGLPSIDPTKCRHCDEPYTADRPIFHDNACSDCFYDVEGVTAYNAVLLAHCTATALE